MAKHMWTAAILAGGQGRRLGGVDKSVLVVEQHPIIGRQLAMLHPLTRLLLNIDDCAAAGARRAYRS